MDVSAYSLVIPDPDGGMWAVNTLHGTVRRVSEEDRALLRDGGRGGDDAATRHRALIDELIAAHIVECEPGADRALYDALLQAARAPGKEKAALRLGFMLDHMTADDIDAAGDFISVGLADELAATAKQFVYGWHFTDAERDRLGDFARLVSRLPLPDGGREKRHFVLHTDGRAALSDDALGALEALDLPRSSGLVVFMLNRRAAQALGGAEAYAERIFEQQARLFSLGLMPNFVLRCTADSIDFMLDEMFEALCFSGVYPRSITATLSKSDAAPDLGCELSGWDWTLYRGKGAALAASDDLALIEPLGRGLADQLRALLRVGEETPVTRQCPFGRRSFLFGADGAIAPCPVMLARAGGDEIGDAKRAAMVDFGNARAGRLDRATIEEWAGRGPESIAACGDCAVAPICGGGCPLDALERQGRLDAAPCPPVEDVITQEARAARRPASDALAPHASQSDKERHAQP